MGAWGMLKGMTEAQNRAVERVREEFEKEVRALSVLLGGSLAKGWGSGTSDLDILLVVAEDFYQEAKAKGELLIYRTDLTDYEGGYVDGKIIPLSFLELVAERGSEPARSAFLGARPLFDRSGRVDGLLNTILAYPEEGREERIRRFHSQVMIWRWFVGEAEKRSDPYLFSRAATEISLFTMRLILAENRLLYPYHKWVTRMVEEAPDKPLGIVEILHELVRHPSVERAERVVQALHSWKPLVVDMREHCHHFLLDSEWNWMEHSAPIGDL